MKHLSTILLATVLPFCASGAAPLKPNLLLIIVDDLGYGQLSCYRHTQAVRTPQIDALARSGIRMTKGYSNDPMCAPTRQSLRSGRYFQRFSGEGGVGNATEGKDMIGQYFSSADYATACIGKSQLPRNPLEHGYGEFFGFMAGIHDYNEVRFSPDEYEMLKNLGNPRGKAAIPQGDEKLKEAISRLDLLTFKNWEESIPYLAQRYSPIFHNTTPVDKFKYLTIEFTDRAIDFIEHKRGKPWFLYLSYNAIHHPFEAPDKYLQARQARPGTEEAQLAQLDCVDDEIGRLLARMDQLDLRNNTLIVLVGDNGGVGNFKGTSWTLRGHKGNLYEGGIRVPFIASWPAVLPAGAVYDHPVIHMDLVPTLLGAAGIRKDVPFDGVNLLPYWLGERKESPHETLFWGRKARVAVRRGDWKLVQTGESESQGSELFNLADDPGETKNLISSEKQHAAKLRELARQWDKDIRSGR
jgi:arylsulfatase A-like enzyme